MIPQIPQTKMTESERRCLGLANKASQSRRCAMLAIMDLGKQWDCREPLEPSIVDVGISYLATLCVIAVEARAEYEKEKSGQPSVRGIQAKCSRDLERRIEALEKLAANDGK